MHGVISLPGTMSYDNYGYSQSYKRMIIIFRWNKNESYQKLWKNESLSFSLFINRTVCQVMIYHLNSLKQLTKMPFLPFHAIKIKIATRWPTLDDKRYPTHDQRQFSHTTDPTLKFMLWHNDEYWDKTDNPVWSHIYLPYMSAIAALIMNLIKH